MADIKVTASFILPGSVLRAETPEKKRKGEKEKKKNESLYRQETIRFRNEKPIVVNLRKGVPATQVLHFSLEAYKNMTSQDNPASGISAYMWKRFSNKVKLESHLKLIAHDLQGVLDEFTILDD